MKCYRVTAAHFCAGLVIAINGVCIRAAPILHWAVGKKLTQIDRYCGHRGWTIEEIALEP